MGFSPRRVSPSSCVVRSRALRTNAAPLDESHRWETHSSLSLQFSPATAAKLRFQFLPLPDQQIDSDDFYARHLAEQLKVIHHNIQRNSESSLAQSQANTGGYLLLPSRNNSEPKGQYPPGLFRMASRVDREKYQGDSNQQNSDKSCHD
jgi:hypothetical protein